MEEVIGKVVLKLDDYCGKDLYSEGEAEDRLLAAVKDHNEEEYNRLIAESGSWSMLYHLSDIREAVADFLNIGKTDTVLEVGAGCGAVTGAFAKKAGKVTCVDLSKKRSMINAYRHRDMDNIEIHVGNFQDVEKHLEEKFDVVTLIGVFEYAGSYIDSDNPYEDMLKLLKGHLKEGGRIITAIENKYGLKYFAGCREDHTGGFYDGIKGYKGIEGVRTFSKNGLRNLAETLDMEIFFYYPYPDYKLPVTVYSDLRLPRVGELSDNIRNFDYDRFTAFDEETVFDELVREEEFPFFSNSFLTVMKSGEKVEGMPSRRTVYSRHSMERRRGRQIRTDLEISHTRQKYIIKYPQSPADEAHLENTARAFEKLSSVFSDTRFKPNAVKRINDGEGHLRRLEFEYLEGPTLSDELNICMAENRMEDLSLLIRSFCETLRGLKDMLPFEETEEFLEIFGKTEINGNYMCMPVTDIDLIFTNLITDRGWNIIDYEWTFDFPVPVDFVIYRAMFYYIKESCADKNMTEILYGLAGIDEKMREIFGRMEYSFQLYIKGDRITLPEMYSIMGRENLKLDRAVNTDKLTWGHRKAKLYFDLGEGFNEKDTLYIDTVTDDDSVVSFTAALPEGCKALRIDPMDRPCILKLLKLENGESVTEVLGNGLLFADSTLIFNTDDPQLVLEKVNAREKLSVSYRLSMLPADIFDDITKTLNGDKKSGYASKLKGRKKGYVRLKL